MHLKFLTQLINKKNIEFYYTHNRKKKRKTEAELSFSNKKLN